jgi:DNA-binding LacI/PurR family transcriptional regulator
MASKTFPQNSDAPGRVADVLYERIRSGVYRPGDLLPPERALASDLGAHRRSIRLAIDQLVEAGLVTQRPHCRPSVSSLLENRDGGIVSRSPSGVASSNFIALIMWHGGGPLEHEGTSQQRIFWGMNQALLNHGYHAVFLNLGELGTDDENVENEARLLTYIHDQGFGGALFYPYAYDRNHELIREVNRKVPIVLLDRNTMGPGMDYVGVQNLEAMKGVTDHLIAQGHRRIAYLTRNERINPVVDRAQGYSDAMWRAGGAEMTEMILTISNYEDERDWVVVDAVFALPPDQRPTAAVCLTDYLAVHLCERLERLGLTVPGDVAVTGFDNIVSTLPNGVGLTTAAQPFEAMGERAVELLIRRMNYGIAPAVSEELPVKLIVRESSISPQFPPART